MATEVPASIAANERIDTLDLLRGVAICGILLMNIPAMGGLWEVDHPPFPAAWTIDWATYGIQRFFFEGSMRGLFTLLFGSGMLVMLRKTEREGIAAPMDVRARTLPRTFFGACSSQGQNASPASLCCARYRCSTGAHCSYSAENNHMTARPTNRPKIGNRTTQSPTPLRTSGARYGAIETNTAAIP